MDAVGACVRNGPAGPRGTEAALSKDEKEAAVGLAVDYCRLTAILTVVCQALALTGRVLTQGSHDGVRV